MATWQQQLHSLIEPAMARSRVTRDVIIGSGVLTEAGAMASRNTDTRHALVMADTAGFGAAGRPVVDSLRAAGFQTTTKVIPDTPLPKASLEEAEAFRLALQADPGLFPVSVGSGVINDLVKYAAFETDRAYMTVATAASMDGYTSAGAPLASEGFKVTIPTRAPVAMLADIDVLAAAPAEMNGWGYGDLAGKVPAGGDWLVADALGIEPLDGAAWPLVQDHLKDWLANPAGIRSGDPDGLARLFIGLTAVGFAMEFHGSSRPASGADHQIAHMWEMEGLAFEGRKVSHGAAVAVSCVAVLALYDWLLNQDLAALDIGRLVKTAPSLETRRAALHTAIPESRVAQKAEAELAQKHADRTQHTARLKTLRDTWPTLKTRLETHLYRADAMAAKLGEAGAPRFAHQIGVTPAHLLRTMHAAAFIRRRYTIFDLLHDTGLMDAALSATLPKLGPHAARAAE